MRSASLCSRTSSVSARTRPTKTATGSRILPAPTGWKPDRALTLRYIPQHRAPLDKGRREVLKHVHRLWGFDVLLEQQNEDGSVELLERCPPRINTL